MRMSLAIVLISALNDSACKSSLPRCPFIHSFTVLVALTCQAQASTMTIIDMDGLTGPGSFQCLQLQGCRCSGEIELIWRGFFLRRDAPTPPVSHACCAAACNINKYPARTGAAARMQERRGPLDLARFGCDNCAAADTSSVADRRARQQVLAANEVGW